MIFNYTNFLNENLAVMDRIMKANNISIVKFDVTMDRKRAGIIPSYMYAAYYKNILIGFNKQMHFLNKSINEFVRNSKKKLDTQINHCLTKCQEIDKKTKLNYPIAPNTDRFEHRFYQFHNIGVDVASFQFVYEKYVCTISFKAKKSFTEFSYNLRAYNVNPFSGITEIKLDSIDIDNLTSSLKMLKLHSIGMFDD